ncbi:hypothetical protein BGZ83_002012 [Gryganskiella cystojenkinii]|nr:hypothetical protein BGZ83_002012 [Gryganskiella cystojenkinii]
MPPPTPAQVHLQHSMYHNQLNAPLGSEDNLLETRSDKVPALVVPLPSPTETDESEESELDGRKQIQQPQHQHRPNYKNVHCHGRVKNPEEMVSETWWKTVFADNLYLQTDGDVVEDPEITLQEIRMLEKIPAVDALLRASQESSATIRLLDLCCGQGRHSLQLAELYPNLSIQGVDQSKYLITLAQNRALAADAAQAVYESSAPSMEQEGCAVRPVSERAQFSMGDCRTIAFEDNHFDLIIVMGNSFGYFANDQEDENVLKEIYRVLKPNGVVVLDLADGGYLRENYSPRGWEWIDDSMMVCRERWLTEDKKRLVSREVVILTNQGVIRDQFYQERLYSLEEIRLLVRDFGLVFMENDEKDKDLLVNRAGAEMSLRGEDLGMMEQRQFIAARKPL